jgi:hypothetical protein
VIWEFILSLKFSSIEMQQELTSIGTFESFDNSVAHIQLPQVNEQNRKNLDMEK